MENTAIHYDGSVQMTEESLTAAQGNEPFEITDEVRKILVEIHIS